MKYFSMFSGIGGFEIPLNDRGFKCVGFSEIDKYAIKIYEKHFPEHKNFGDCTKIDPSTIPNFDLLVGGFPCQAFSIAGKRRGFDDTRGTLFFDIARILKYKKPRRFLLENVKGLLSHDSGKTFATILGVLSNLGYRIEWQVLNSKHFGVPQNRERVFIVGYLGGGSGRKIFPVGEDDETHTFNKERTELKTKPASAIATREGRRKENNFIVENNLEYVGAIMSEKNKKWLEDGKQLSRNFPQGQRVYSSNGISSTIASQAGGLGAKTGLYSVKAVLTPDRIKRRQRGRRFKENGEPSFTLTGQDKHGVMVDTRIRRLTPTECERLQGFPDGWTEGGIDSGGKVVATSDTQRYKCLGNAVTVNVIEYLINRLYL